MSQKWSPEQIAGVGKIMGHVVSHERIYGFIQRDKLRGGKLYKQLRHGHRKYRKGSHAKRVIIPNRVGIECRPAIVDKKKRFGDWEVDTVLGENCGRCRASNGWHVVALPWPCPDDYEQAVSSFK